MHLVNPHGTDKVLTPRLLAGEACEEARKKAVELPKIQVRAREAGDILMLGMGAFTPLVGFMGRADYDGLAEAMKQR